MIIIADCGSTKTHWCTLHNGEKQGEYYTPGMNAVLLGANEIAQLVRDELLPQLGDESGRITEIYFYGAGCLGDEICGNVRSALSTVFTRAGKIEVDTDLLGAARALCGHKPGIACIMGTGSNSCYYDGREIVDNVSPLGYILGDEGSGAVLGKLLVGDVLKSQLPADICRKFLDEYRLDRLAIIHRVYKEPCANRFLASLSPFLKENIGREEIERLVVNAFKAFFRRNIANYEAAESLPVNFIGSIAVHYSEQLRKAAAECGYRVGQITQSPMPGLIDWLK